MIQSVVGKVKALKTCARHAALAAAALGTGCSGLPSGLDYPENLPGDIAGDIASPEGDSGGSIGFNSFKVKADSCKLPSGQLIDTHTVVAQLNQEDFSRFLEQAGAKLAPTKARGNLYWYDIPVRENDKEDKRTLRLRLAVLGSPEEAAIDLHRSLLEHGPGWWGVRRSNLALLVPKAGLGDAMRFALKYKLPCWGSMAYAGADDVYVIPGPYSQL
jgi:hypothetical protein